MADDYKVVATGREAIASLVGDWRDFADDDVSFQDFAADVLDALEDDPDALFEFDAEMSMQSLKRLASGEELAALRDQILKGNTFWNPVTGTFLDSNLDTDSPNYYLGKVALPDAATFIGNVVSRPGGPADVCFYDVSDSTTLSTYGVAPESIEMKNVDLLQIAGIDQDAGVLRERYADALARKLAPEPGFTMYPLLADANESPVAQVARALDAHGYHELAQAFVVRVAEVSAPWLKGAIEPLAIAPEPEKRQAPFKAAAVGKRETAKPKPADDGRDDAHVLFDDDARRIKALFSEKITLGVRSVKRHVTFGVLTVDGRPAQHDITVSFYDNQALLRPENRRPWTLLKVCDSDVRVRFGQVANIANRSVFVLDPGLSKDDPAYASAYDMRQVYESGEKISLKQLLSEAYQLGGYGEYPDRLNSNGVTAAQANAMAAAAIGAPKKALDPAGMASQARLAARSRKQEPDRGAGGIHL